MRHAFGIDEQQNFLDIGRSAHGDDVVDHLISARIAGRNMEVSENVVSVAAQVLDEPLRDGVLAGHADNRAAAQRAALERARQNCAPNGPVNEQRDRSRRPKQQNVAARQIVTDAPGKHAGRQNEEGSAPCAQHASRLIVDHDEPRGTVKLLNAHRGDEQDGHEHCRSDGVRKFAFEFRRDIVV